MFSHRYTALVALTGLVSLATSLAQPSSAQAAPSDFSHIFEPSTSVPMTESPERALLSARVPQCDSSDCWPGGVQPTPQAIGLRNVYLNFSGVTLQASANGPDDATTNTTWMIADVVGDNGSLTIPPFNWNDLGSLSGATSQQEIIDYTLAELRSYHNPYNVAFTTTRPTSGTYHMVVFGGTCQGVVGTSCAGIAPLDCSDFSPSNIVFAFPGGLRAVDLATTAAQELAHAFGLSHTYDTTDIMYPQIQSTLPEGYGAGAIPPEDQGPCGNGSYQDSHAKLLSIIGSQGEDGMVPSVLITSPARNAVVSVGTPIVATITDDSPIVKVELIINNTIMGSKSSPPFDFKIPANAPLGEASIELQATDSWDNVSGHRVNVYIGTGNEEPCDNGACPEGQTCATDNLCYSDEPGSAGALGDFCADNESCDSGVCASVDAENRCSQTCNAESVCPDGFECRGDVACWPTEESGGESGGCSLSGSGSGALSTLGFLLFAFVLGGRRRRHSKQ
jgi:hypothetical protein